MPTRRSILQSAGLAVSPSLMLAEPSLPDVDVFLSVFAKRQTVRRYKPDPVPEAHIRAILDAARRPPTCMNAQPWKFLVIRDKETIKKLHKRDLTYVFEQLEKHPQYIALSPEKKETQKKSSREMIDGYFTAPVFVVVLVDKECPCSGLTVNHDGPMAAGYLMLAARAFGYGTVYLTDGVPDAVTREVLNIPARYHRVCMTPIGVPDRWPEPKPKKPLDELIAWEKL